MALPSVDVIATKILFDAKDAILALQAWNTKLDSAAAKTKFFKDLIKATSTQMGGDMKAATSAVARFSSALEVNPAYLRKMGDEGKSAFQKLTEGAHFARIALGALVSMLLFQTLQAIQNVFGTAINNLREFEATLYRISNVERELSLKGIEVSVQGLKKGVDDIKKLLPIFSEEDISQMVGSLATATSHLGLGEQQILDLAKAIAILNIQSVEEETLLQTQAKVVNAIVTSQSRGVGNLGITFSKNRIEAEALKLGLLELGETMADLSDAEKTQAKLAIVLDKANIEGAADELGALNGYLETTDAKSQELKATWNDFLRDVAIQFAPLIIEFLQSTIDLVKGWSESLERNKEIWTFISSVMAGIQRVQHDINTENQDASGLEKLVNTLIPSLGKLEDFKIGDVWQSFNEGFNEAKERADNFGKATETATGDVDELYSEIEDSEAAESALEDLRQKIEDIKIDARQAQEDLDLKLGQKRSDIDVEYDRKRADEATRHSQKLQDINQDALDKIEDAKRKAREEEKKAEQDLLQKLKELRQRFLMDLEDALHARDARQILRLIREYNFEKQNILDRKKLDEQQRKDKLAEDLKAIEIERQRRIEQEKIEHRRKLEDLALSKKRELEELALWYKREQEDIQRNVEQKLEKLLNGYIQEGKIHDQQLSAIEGILAQHFGTQMGMVDRLVAYAKLRFAEMGRLSITPATTSPYFQSEKGLVPPPVVGQQNALGGYGGAGAVPSSVKKQTEKIKSGRVPAYADGGTLFAKQPTLALFGEKTPEFARFIPASQMGRGGGGDMMGMNGEIGLELTLSPDLEARVVKNAMQGTAKIVTKIRRSKT